MKSAVGVDTRAGAVPAISPVGGRRSINLKAQLKIICSAKPRVANVIPECPDIIKHLDALCSRFESRILKGVHNELIKLKLRGLKAQLAAFEYHRALVTVNGIEMTQRALIRKGERI